MMHYYFHDLYRFVITLGVVKIPLGGDFISSQCKQFLDAEKINIVPSCFIASKTAVGAKEKAIHTMKPRVKGMTLSWYTYAVNVRNCLFKHLINFVIWYPFKKNCFSSSVLSKILNIRLSKFPNPSLMEGLLKHFHLSPMSFLMDIIR